MLAFIAEYFVPILFLGLLLGPKVYFELTSAANSNKPTDTRDTEQLLQRYGFLLTESAKEAGIDFVHQPPRLDQRLEHIGPQIASMGASVSVVDFDRDGFGRRSARHSIEGELQRLQRFGQGLHAGEAPGGLALQAMLDDLDQRARQLGAKLRQRRDGRRQRLRAQRVRIVAWEGRAMRE